MAILAMYITGRMPLPRRVGGRTPFGPTAHANNLVRVLKVAGSIKETPHPLRTSSPSPSEMVSLSIEGRCKS
jgi:hypothetical protein